MAWQDIARVVAPTLATGLLGPLGGVVAKVAADALFPGDPNAKQTATPQTIIQHIENLTAPDDIAKLKQAELDVRKFEADNKIRLAEIQARDVEGAREMRISALASGNKTADILSWLIMISFLFIAALVLIGCGLFVAGELPTPSGEAWVAVSGLVGAIVGYFFANAQQVVGFYFGSSSGSAAKTDQIASIASNTQQTLTAFARNPQPTASAGPTVTRTHVPGGATVTTATGEPSADELTRNEAPRQTTSPSVNARWDTCVAYILEREGGFSTDRDDPGGPTNMGITQRTLAAWRNEDVTAEDVRNLRIDEAKAIYRAHYWNVARCDALQPGVDLSVFDVAVMSGPGQAVRFLQRAAAMQEHDVDGVVGPKTLSALQKVPTTNVIEDIARQRAAFYDDVVQRKPSLEKYLQGWKSRAVMTRDRSLSMNRLWA